MVALLRLLFAVLGAFWLFLGGLGVFGAVDFGLATGARFLGVLMLGNGTALALAGWLSLRGHRVVDFLAVTLVLANLVLSITDEVGPLDLASLVVNGAVFGLLVVALRSRPEETEGEDSMGVQEEPRPHPGEGEEIDDRPLSRAQLDALAGALARAGKILRAARLAAFTGWTLLAIGILSFLVSLFSVTGILVGCALLAIGWNELEGRKMILRFDAGGAWRLARNQLWFLGVIVLYCVWSVYKARFHPAPELAQVEELLELGPGFVANATSAFYGLVLVVGVVYQLATYRYHAARIRMVEEYVAETPPWIVEVQQVLQGAPGEGAPRTLQQ